MGVSAGAFQNVDFRLRIRTASTFGNPDGSADALVVSSQTGVGQAFLRDAPTGDGNEINTLTGDPTFGSYRVTVIDAGVSVTPPGLIPQSGIVTSILADTQGRNQLLSRRAYIESSNDQGTTWQLWAAGYVNRIRLVSAASYEFDIGETRRLETATTVFTTITRGLDYGTCVLGGPIGYTPPSINWVRQRPTDYIRSQSQQSFTMRAALWSPTPSYTPGQCVLGSYSSGIYYICTAGNTNQPPPAAAYWQAIPPGVVPAGLYTATATYAINNCVVGTDSLAYLAIKAVPTNTPPPNVNYWIALQAVLLPSWALVQDFGGAQCVVSTVGGSTQSFEMTLQGGWFRVPVKNPGDPTWKWYSDNKISAELGQVNSLIPQLCAQFGMSPVGYGGTYVNPWHVVGVNVPPGVATALQGGVHDTVLGNLGWTIGGIALQCELPTGQVVTVGAYPQLHNTAIDKGTRYTSTPVLVYPKARTIRVDWHDFYSIDPNTYQQVAPLDQNGNAVSMPAKGTTLMVRAVVVPISDSAPLHIAMHPIDLMAHVWTNAGIGYNAANIGAIRDALGSDLVLMLRPTQSMTLSDLWSQYIGGPLGLSLRISSVAATDQWGNSREGLYEIVDCRSVPTALPTVTWTDADMYGEEGTTGEGLFNLGEDTICQNVTVTSDSYSAWDISLNQNRPLDDVVPITSTANYIDQDFATFGTQTQQYTIPGGFAHALMQAGGLMGTFMASKANLIFERYGRGCTRSWLPILGTSPQVSVGDLVLVSSIRLPNPAINARGGTRLCQVIKKSPVEQGAVYEVEDLGPQEQPAPLAPTLTVALDPADSNHVVDVTITNLSALQTQYPKGSIQIQYAVQATIPTVAGSIATDRMLNSFGSLNMVILPAVPIGSTVWVRAQARPGGGQLPSVWSTWTQITTNTPAPISALSWTDSGNGAGTLSWVNGDITTPIQVWMSQAIASGYTPTASTVYVSAAGISLPIGSSQTLTAVVYDQIGDVMPGATVTWSSSNPSIASVNSSTGQVTGVALGVCTITATSGSATGTCLTTVTAAATVASITLTPNPFSGNAGTNITFTAVVKDNYGNVMTGRTLNWTSSAGTITSGGVLTLPGSQVLGMTVTATDSVVTSVSGSATGNSLLVFATMAQAARSAGLRYLSTHVQAYENDTTFYRVYGTNVTTPNTGLNLPPLSANYGTTTVANGADSRHWSDLTDINYVSAYTSSATAHAANNSTLAAITGQLWFKLRLRVDELLALPINSGAGFFNISSSTTPGTYTNQKVDCYCQTGATAGNVSFLVAAFGTGGTRSAFAGSGNINFNVLTGNQRCPPGSFITLVASLDPVTNHLINVWVYNDNNVTLAAPASTALTVALNVDGGANGCILLNCASNPNGHTQAIRYAGLAFYSGAYPGTDLARWQPAQVSDSGIVAGYTLGEAGTGTVGSHTAFRGVNMTTSAGVTGAWDCGCPYSWPVWPNGPGGLLTDENAWRTVYTVQSVASPTSITFKSPTPYGPTVAKCRALGIRVRHYIFSGAGTDSVLGPQMTSKTNVQNILNTYVSGIVNNCLTNYGTAAQGGIADWNVNEFILNGYTASAMQTYYPITSTDPGWVGYIANLIHSLDPSANLMFNFNRCHNTRDLSNQQTLALAYLNNFSAYYPSIPKNQMILAQEWHVHNTTDVSSFNATDATGWINWVTQIAAAGYKWCPSEYDCCDLANNGQTGPTAWPARRQLCCTQAQIATQAWANSAVLPSCHSIGAWGLGSLHNWILVDGLAGSNRADGDVESNSLLGFSYEYMGGQGSNQDVYSVFSNFFASL